MLIIEECKPSLNMQGDSARAKSFNDIPKMYIMFYTYLNPCVTLIFSFLL